MIMKSARFTRTSWQRKRSNTVLSTKERIIHAREKHPCAHLQDIGDRVGVTREYVRQVLQKSNKPTRAYHQIYLCNFCGDVIPKPNKLFCNKFCEHNYHAFLILTLKCDYCGEIFTRPNHVRMDIVRKNHTFCNRRCYHQWRVGRPIR